MEQGSKHNEEFLELNSEAKKFLEKVVIGDQQAVETFAKGLSGPLKLPGITPEEIFEIKNES